jgi:hypothetical protein
LGEILAGHPQSLSKKLADHFTSSCNSAQVFAYGGVSSTHCRDLE